MIRIDEIWLAREPLDMRAGPDTTLARVVQSFGEARPHCAYLFANKRANRMKVLVHDGFGLWLAARRLHRGKFIWSSLREGRAVALDEEQFRALVTGLPWQRAGGAVQHRGYRPPGGARRRLREHARDHQPGEQRDQRVPASGKVLV